MRAKDHNDPNCPRCGFNLKIKKSEVWDKSQVKPSSQVQVRRGAGELQIDLRWLSPSSGVYFLFTLAWNGFMAFVISLMYLNPEKIVSPKLALVVIGFFSLIGISLAYGALCELLNTTTLLIKNRRLVIFTRPISTSPIQSYNLDEIANISVERSVQSRNKKKKFFRYALNVNLKVGKKKHLYRARDLNEALYVEKLLEEHLTLKDDPNLDKIS